jgi:3-phenylpropionate/trans-cinnamate dioxygenase ferredoxin subunit
MGWVKPATSWWSDAYMADYTRYDPEDCDFVVIGPADEVKNGERQFVEIDELAIVIFNVAGQFYAIADVCSHDDGPLGDGDVDGYEVSCPRHGASFDIRSGKVLSLPAVVDIPAYPVRVVGGQIEIGLPKG